MAIGMQCLKEVQQMDWAGIVKRSLGGKPHSRI